MFKNALFSIFNKGINALVPLALIPLCNNLFGVSEFGMLIYFQSIVGLIITFADYGFSVSALKMVSDNSKNHNKLNELLIDITVIKTLILITGGLIIYAYLKIFTHKVHLTENFILFFFVFLSLAMQSIIPNWFYQGIKKNHSFAIINIGSKLLLAIFLSTFFINGKHLYRLPQIEFFTNSLVVLVCFFQLKKMINLKFKFPSIKGIFYQFKSGFNIFTVVLIYWIINGGSVLILEQYVSNHELGIFGTFLRISYYSFAVFQPIIFAFIPYFSESFKSSELEGIILYKRVFKFFFCGSLSILSIIYWALFYYMHLLFRNEVSTYFKENHLLPFFLLLWTFFLLLNNFSASMILLNRGFENIFRNSQLLNGLIALISMIVLGKYFGSVGVAIGMTLGEIFFSISIFKFSFIYNFKSYERFSCKL